VFQSVRLDTSLITLVFGVFDGSVAPALHRALEADVADGVTDIVIDLCQATHVDEGAVAVLAAAAVTVLGVGGRLWLALGPGDVMPIEDVSAVRAVFSG
jgi:anti-anti-sigma regulatory factor